MKLMSALEIEKKEDVKMTKKDALIRVKSMLSKSMDEHGEAIVVTVNAAGLPHASWMGTLSSPNIGKLLTMTSPDSRKVLNILENPRVEWIFTGSNKDEIELAVPKENAYKIMWPPFLA